MMTVADRVKIRREELGMSQEELAHKMGLKSRSSITRIEKSGDDITLKDVERLSAALDCSPLYLMDWSKEVYYDPKNHVMWEFSRKKPSKDDDTEDVLTEKEVRFLETYSQLSDEQKKLVENMMKAFLEK